VFEVASAAEAESDEKTKTDENHVFKPSLSLCNGYAVKAAEETQRRRRLGFSSTSMPSAA
jgi:hypothetical protein